MTTSGPLLCSVSGTNKENGFLYILNEKKEKEMLWVDLGDNVLELTFATL